MASKNPERDQAAGRALTKWMRANGYSDSRLAREVQRSVPAVATWRKGTRPMKRERDWLAQKLGWEWDNPPGCDYAPGSVSRAQVPTTTEITAPMLDATSIEAILLAQSVVSSGQPLDPNDPVGGFVLQVLRDILTETVETRTRQDRVSQDVVTVRNMVLDHRDPKGLLQLLRERNAFPSTTLDMVERSLPQTTSFGVPQTAEA